MGLPLDTLALRRPDYRNLLHALARYRQLAADTTIPTVPLPDHLPVKPGDSLDIVPELRDRLAALGDLDRADAAGIAHGVYAGPLVDAIRRFQRRHGLDDDGVIGRATLLALQTPIATRVAQMERALAALRQEPPVPSGPFVVVNVPAFHLFAYDGNPDDTTPALDSRVIVGQAVKRETPSMMPQLRLLDFWPYWDVPRSIVVNEMLPSMLRDSLYLRRENMEMVTPSGSAVGDSVTAGALDSLRAGTLRVRQRPGPTNALGFVKFVIPNDSNVYLHDTPDKSLFARPRRDFSHGCIRVEQARALAIWASRGLASWTADSVDAALAGPGSRRVALPRPIPVIIEYVTVMASQDGTVWFLPDIYERAAHSLNGW
ncbi:MAG: L,D-transpeptidase family protein [Gemmatimonadota bacterium]|nr:L,D-transpeptidase family protein [Gemmatimonadota bacterium]